MDIKRTGLPLRQKILVFKPGNCHICNQNNVKVRPLWCGKHNYCRMCTEYVPRLVNKDFSCKKCPRGMRQLDAGIESVASFLASRVGSPKDMEGPNKRNPFESSASVCEDDDSDDDDLGGNNQDLDKLLEVLTKPSSPRKSPRNTEKCTVLRPIPRKQSFLSFPNASDSKSPNAFMIGSTVTELLSCSQIRREAFEHRGSPAKRTTGPAPAYATCYFNNGVEFPADEEEERGSSPSKGARIHSCQSYTSNEDDDNSTVTDSSREAELEELREMIGCIEGPSCVSSSSSRSGPDVSPASSFGGTLYDAFWDQI